MLNFSDKPGTKKAPMGGLRHLDHLSRYVILYTSETNKPASVFSTLASLFLVSPFMALSHFLLLSPVCPFSSFRSMGELSFRRFISIFSSSVISGALLLEPSVLMSSPSARFSGFICGKHGMRYGYVACIDSAA